MRDELAAGHGKRIYDTYITAIEKYLIPYYGNHNIDNIDYKLVKGFEAFRRTINDKDIKASTQNTYNAAMGRIFAVALDRGYVSQLHIPTLINKAADGDRRPDFTLDEYNRLVKYMDVWVTQGKGRGATKDKVPMMRELLRDYVVVLTNTGIRPGEEANRLKWNQLRWETVDGERNLYIAMTSKKGRGGKAKMREAIVKPAGIEAFTRIHTAADDLQNLTFEQLTQQKSSEFVFRLADGTQTANLNQTFEQLLTDAGLLVDPRTGDNRTLYSLRHTYATLSVSAGVTYEFLEKQMGTSVAMLSKHYDHAKTRQVGKHLSKPLGVSVMTAAPVVAPVFAGIDQNTLAIATHDFGEREIEVDDNGVVRLVAIK